MDAVAWDQRYAASELVWSAGPNQWIEDVGRDLTPGLALDVAAGEGRNAIWLARQGWRVVAADFSTVAIGRARGLAAAQLGAHAHRVHAVVTDATQAAPGEPGIYDLVVVCYLQLPEPAWAAVLRQAVNALAPHGRVVIVLHARENVTRGYGGPQDVSVLHDPHDVVAVLAELPVAVDVERAELVTRVVEDANGRHEAIDTLIVARRRPGPQIPPGV